MPSECLAHCIINADNEVAPFPIVVLESCTRITGSIFILFDEGGLETSLTGGHSEGDGFAAIFISLDIESCWGDDSCISDGDGIAAIFIYSSGVGLLANPLFVLSNKTLLSNEILAGTVEFTVVDSAVSLGMILLFNLVLFCFPPCVCNSCGSG